MVGNPNDETNFPHKLLLTNTQVANLCKACVNKSSTDIKLSKTQLSKMIQSGGLLGGLIGPLFKTGSPLMKNVIQPLAKSVLIPLGLTAAAPAAYAGIHKKIRRLRSSFGFYFAGNHANIIKLRNGRYYEINQIS